MEKVRSISKMTSSARTESTPTSSRREASAAKSSLVSAILATISLRVCSIASPVSGYKGRASRSGGCSRQLGEDSLGQGVDTAKVLGIDLGGIQGGAEALVEKGRQIQGGEGIQDSRLQ